jgi:hypothetical protein
MVNPLARVVMNNVSKKVNPGSSIGPKDKGNSLNLKGLDAVANKMRRDDKAKEPSLTKREPSFARETSSEKKVSNLTLKEQDLIREVIKGEREVKEGKHTATIMTLDEAVEKIKGSR